MSVESGSGIDIMARLPSHPPSHSPHPDSLCVTGLTIMKLSTLIYSHGFEEGADQQPIYVHILLQSLTRTATGRRTHRPPCLPAVLLRDHQSLDMLGLWESDLSWS